MKGLNIWGICTFVMPIALGIISALVLIITLILDGVSKLIKKIKEEIC